MSEATHQKYQPTPTRGVAGYVLAQYVVRVGVAALFLFTQIFTQKACCPPRATS